MTPIPHGRLQSTPDGYDLVLTRQFPAPITDVWASLTEPDRTARWYGPWEGEGRPGRTVRLQMTAEDGAPWTDVHIDECEPPEHLAVTSLDDTGTFRLELWLSESAGRTTLRFVQHLDTLDGVADFGPGWEYYLDRLAVSLTGPLAGRSALAWPDYVGQREHYAELARTL